jgi:HSP20 family molecular chaperone IbpA
MATSKLAPSGKVPSATPQIITDRSGKEALDQAIQRRVAERAYGLYEESGGEHGNHEKHWLQAESEILRRGLEIRESGSWLSMNATLPDAAAEDVRVYVEPERVFIHAQKATPTQDVSFHMQSLAQQELFLVGDLSVEIDPATASASLKDQKLTLMVKKRSPATTSASQAGRTAE